MGLVGGREKLKRGTHTDRWSKLDIIGIKVNQWFAWGFLAFFVAFIIYAIIDGMVRGML